MKFPAFSVKKIPKKRAIGQAYNKKTHRSIDRWLLLVTVLLSLFGILMVYDASVAIAIRDFSNQYHFVRDQFLWLVIGLVAMVVFSRIDYHVWYKLALPLLLLTIGLLVAVFVPGLGVTALGAARWLNVGLFTLQPAELAKLVLVIYLSAWLSNKEKGRFIAFLLLLGMVFGLVVFEPDLGTGVIIVALSMAMYFFSGAPVWQFIFLVPLIISGVLGLAVASPYRFRRLTSYLDLESDPLGASYQIRQVLYAFGSGGWLGVGIGKSRQKYEYLPEANTDAIFAIIGEEIGFIGATVVVLLFLFLIWRGFRVAKRAPDSFGRLLAMGIASWIGIQTAINFAAMVALVPLTGVPLPLISYGGSSLIVVLSAIGIVLNVSKQRV